MELLKIRDDTLKKLNSFAVDSRREGDSYRKSKNRRGKPEKLVGDFFGFPNSQQGRDELSVQQRKCSQTESQRKKCKLLEIKIYYS